MSLERHGEKLRRVRATSLRRIASKREAERLAFTYAEGDLEDANMRAQVIRAIAASNAAEAMLTAHVEDLLADLVDDEDME